MTAHSIIDDAKDLLVMAIGEGCDLGELSKALDIIGSTAFREEFLHRLRGINDSGERGAGSVNRRMERTGPSVQETMRS